jgi:transcriptional regulator with XRE-family HTH domain
MSRVKYGVRCVPRRRDTARARFVPCHFCPRTSNSSRLGSERSGYERGLSQEQAATQLGTGVRNVKRWEKDTDPGALMFLRMISLYGISLEPSPDGYSLPMSPQSSRACRIRSRHFVLRLPAKISRQPTQLVLDPLKPMDERDLLWRHSTTPSCHSRSSSVRTQRGFDFDRLTVVICIALLATSQSTHVNTKTCAKERDFRC